MKNIFRILIGALLLSFIFAGCSSKEPEKPKDNRKVYVDPEYDGAPKWVLVPFVEGAIAEVGSASKNAGNDRSFQRAEAMANARDNLAKLISVKVKNMFRSFKTATSAGDGGTFDKTSDAVSKQISVQSLNGTRQKDMWMSRSGTLYVLMVVDAKSVSSLMASQAKSSYKNDQAAYQRFLAAKAQGELDAELEKMGR